MNHIIDQDAIDDAHSLITSSNVTAPAILLKRPTPIDQIPKWGLKPVPSRSTPREETDGRSRLLDLRTS